MFEAEKILKEFLTETNILTESEFDLLSESARNQTIKELTQKFLTKLSTNLSKVNVKMINASRGDISKLKMIDDIQTAISKLESLEYTDRTVLSPIAKDNINVITKSFMRLREKSSFFKEAYREKKVLLISYYQVLVIALIRSASYVISASTTSANGKLEIKSNVSIIETGDIRTLRKFVEDGNNSVFQKGITSVNNFREAFFEISDEFYGLLENGDIIKMVTDGISNIVNSLDRGGTLTRFLYDASGILMILLSMRDVVYSAIRSVFSNFDLLTYLKGFINFDKLSVAEMSNVVSTNNRIEKDTVEVARLVDREISNENDQIKSMIQSYKPVPNPEITSNDDNFSLGF